MAPPPVSIYVTSLTSQPKVRQNIELLRRSLRALEIPYTEHDLVMDEEAKTRWQRAKPPGQVIGLPGYLVGGEWVGTIDDFEYAAETSTLPAFLRQDVDLAADQSMGEADLDRLLREMSEADLDTLLQEGDKGLDTKPAPKVDVPKSAPKASDASSAAPKADASFGAVPSAKAAMDSVHPSGAGLAGISTAAQQTIASITQKAQEVIEGLGGPEAHSGTADDPRTPTSSTFPLNVQKAAAHSTASSSDKAMVTEPRAIDTSTAESSSSSPEFAIASPLSTPSRATGLDAKQRSRRLSKEDKEEIAHKMMSANSVEGLLESLDMAEGKEKRE